MAYQATPRFTGQSLAVTNPIGFADDIASLGNLIDKLSERRIQQARQEEQLALQRQDRELAQAKEARMEAQGLRKSKAEWIKHNVGQKSLADARAARGGSAEPLYMYDDEGNLRTFNPEDIPFAPTATQPGEAGVDLPPFPTEGPQDIDAALQGTGGVPGAPELPPVAPPAPIETLQGTPPGPETMAMLNALPFGGEKPAAPSPATQAPPAAPEPPVGPQPQAGSAIMRPPVVRGVSYKALPDLATVENLTEAQLDAGPPGAPGQAPRGKRVIYRGTPLGDITIDQEQARNDLRAQRQFDAEGIQQQLQNPNLPPEARKYLETQLAVTLGGIPPKPGQTILAEAGKTARQQTGISAQERMQTERLNAAVSLEQLKQEGRIKLKQTPKSKLGKGTSGGIDGIRVGNPDATGEFIPIPQTRYGKRPDMLIGQVRQDWRTWSMNNDIKTQFRGLRRLYLAQNNVEANGPHSGVLNIEAAFNYLGFVRGGVPVQNETREMLDHRRTWGDRLHGLLARAEIAVPLQKFLKGEELTEEEANRAMNVMSEGERQRILEGIAESREVMSGQVAASLEPFLGNYAGLQGPGGVLMQKAATRTVNSMLSVAGLPAVIDPYGLGDRTAPMASPSLAAPKGEAQSSPSGGSQALEAAVNKLLEGKKNGVAK
jgi:hypothetical protein